MTTTQTLSDLDKPIQLKLKRCVTLSKSLSTKSFPKWQKRQTSRLEEWDRTYHSEALISVLKEDQELLQMYNGLFDALNRHFRALKKCPSDEDALDDSRKFEDQNESSPFVAERDSSSRRTVDIEVKSSQTQARYLGVEQRHPPSIHSAVSGLSEAYSDIGTHEMDEEAVDESKAMVAEFIQKLFDITESLPLDSKLEKGNESTKSPQESAYRDFFYRETHRTVSKLMPKAQPFMLHRLSRAGSTKLRELIESKRELKQTLDQTYYPGKYTADATDSWLRRIGSLPTDVISNPNLNLDWIEQPLIRRHTGDERLRRSKGDQLNWIFLQGIGSHSQSQAGEGDLHLSDESDSESLTSDSQDVNKDRRLKETPAGLTPRIFICFDEACSNPYTHYDSFQSWEKHMRETHLNLIQTGHWTCKAWCHASEPSGYPNFHSEHEFRDHMKETHPAMFKKDLEFLKDLAKACYRPPPPNTAQVNCPLCTEEWERDLQHNGTWDAKLLLTHVASHLEEISSRMIPLPTYDEPIRQKTPAPTYEGSVIETNWWIKQTIGEIPKLK